MPKRIVLLVALTVYFAALGLSSSASAALIDLGTITRDTDTGLDWLDLSETAGLSYNQVVASALILSDGWRYATEAEVCVWFSGTCPGSDLIPASGYLSLLNPGGLDGIYGSTPFAGFHYLANNFPIPPFDWRVGINAFSDDNAGQNGVGSLLVRPVLVPEPGTAILLAGGVLALAFATPRLQTAAETQWLKSERSEHPR